MLVSVVESLPSPPVAQEARLPGLIDCSPGAKFIDPNLRNAMIKSGKSNQDPVVAYISKMASVPESELPEFACRRGTLSPAEAKEMGRRKRIEIARTQALENRCESSDRIGELSIPDKKSTPEETDVQEQTEHLIGYARLYSGILSVGDSVYVLPPKFSPEYPHKSPEPKKVTVTALYLLMGRGLEPLTSVPAGVLFGIGGLGGHVLKSGTICSQLEGSINLAGVTMGSKPIVRVALEPVNPADLEKMVGGLKLLVQSDPCAEYEQFESGEHVLLTAGELHLERCLTDLRERFAHCEIQAGEPIVPYRETIIRAEEMKPPANRELGRGGVIAVTASKQVTIKLTVRPLPVEVTEFLKKRLIAINQLYSDRQNLSTANQENGNQNSHLNEDDSVNKLVDDSKLLSLLDSKEQLRTVFESIKGHRDIWANSIDRIIAFGPRGSGPNILIDATPGTVFGRS